METVYVVMGLHPSQRVNEINAVFKEKKKAEEYCFRHINCNIKEYSYSDDKTYTVEGINFVMSEHDYNQYGDMTINDTGFGFRVAPENSGDGDSCGGGCSGCGH